MKRCVSLTFDSSHLQVSRASVRIVIYGGMNAAELLECSRAAILSMSNPSQPNYGLEEGLLSHICTSHSCTDVSNIHALKFEVEVSSVALTVGKCASSCRSIETGARELDELRWTEDFGDERRGVMTCLTDSLELGLLGGREQ